jgi:hypothetical protein
MELDGYSVYYELLQLLGLLCEVKSWEIQKYEVCSGLNMAEDHFQLKFSAQEVNFLEVMLGK